MMDIEGEASHGGNIWAASKRWDIAPQKFLDYSANINPLGPSPRSLSAIRRSLGLLTHYPEPTSAELKNKLGQYLHTEPNNLVLGNGGSELIYLMGRMFGQGRIIRLAPTFSEYGQGLDEPEILEILLRPQEQFRLPADDICAQLKTGDLLFLGNPNNPTGNLFPRRELIKIVQQADAIAAVVVVDEAFIDFVGDEAASMRDLAPKLPGLIVVGSMTKFFAIPALRLGYAVAAATNIRRMEQLLPPWRINTLAQAAAGAAIDDREYIKNTIQLVSQERTFLTAGLSQIPGLKVYPSVANFLLVDGAGTGVSSEQLQARLGPEGVLIRQCGNFRNLSPYFFRLAVKNRSDNQVLVNILRKALT